ncbi:MAG: hypothetical protein HYY24_18230 [Verrucomicrobia bacterium]|nr:hypothetical protein [Verrucomicrobiota bacterium]
MKNSLLTVVATFLALALPGPTQAAWIQYLDGTTVPEAPWIVFQDASGTGSGDTIIVDFLDPATGTKNQAMRVNSGSGANEWYVGAFFTDEVVAGIRFRVVEFSETGKENLLSVTTRSKHLAPSPALTLVDGRFKLWNYVIADSEILDIGPVVKDEFHTVYLYARADGATKLWWDGKLLFDGQAPLVNPYDGYLEWGSGSWQFDAEDTIDFDWVGWGEVGDLPLSLTSTPAHGSVFQDPTAGFKFTIASQPTLAPGVAANGVALMVNGVDRTGELAITGDNASRQGSWAGLAANRVYHVAIKVTDVAGTVANYTVDFDTFSPGNFSFEAEDFNFEGGQFLETIVLSSVAAADNYVDRLGVEDIDHKETTPTDPPTGQHQYRVDSLVGTERTRDELRPQYLAAQVQDPDVTDFNVGWVEVDEWLNYTRTFPAGQYRLYGRFAFGTLGESFEAVVGKVANPTSANQTMTPLGVFKGGPGRGWQTFDYVPLTDAQGQLVSLNLNGAETLRVTLTSGGFNANYYLLVPAPPAPPTLLIARQQDEIAISWDGSGFTLLSTETLGTSWAPVANQTNPFKTRPTARAAFYRLSQ